MGVRRGDTVVVATGGGFGGKPRPAVVVQSDLLADHSTTILLVFTSDSREGRPFRPRFAAQPGNGLLTDSSLMIDVPVTVRMDQIGRIIGQLEASEMAEIDRLLFLVFGLAQSDL